MNRSTALLAVFLVIVMVLASCGRGGGGGGKSPSARATATAEALLAQTPSPTPSPTAELAATRAPTATPVAPATATAPPTPTTQAPTGLKVYFIDVGQGDATLIVAASGESLLIDGGRSKTRIRERLNSLGLTDLDAILATHSDADHIAGLIEVFDLYQVERFYWNGQLHDTQTFQNLMAAAEAEGAQVTVSRRGDTIALGNLSLSVLHPASLSGDSNVDSIVVLLSCGTVEVLLTGDAEVPSEEDMLAAGVVTDIDVLKVGHHGSRTSTSAAFLTATAPEVGVISAGLNNQYGHPHQEVVDRLTAAGVELWYTDTTDQDDTVRLVSDCQTFTIERVGALTTEPTPTPSPTPTPTPVPTATTAPTLTATPSGTPSTVTTVSAGTVFVTEIMPNPAAVSDTSGEWFEIYNSRSDVAVDINGWTIRDHGTNTHVIVNGGPLLVAPQGFLVLGRNSDPATNGGVTVDYQYSSFSLVNTDDEIELVDLAGTVVDTLVYTSSLVFNGASASLDPVALDAVSHDQASNWCASVSLLPAGDRGTPGAANDPCT